MEASGSGGRMNMRYLGIIAVAGLVVLLAASATYAVNVTGDPVADGWTFGGRSLAQGTYIRGAANMGFDIYTTGFTLCSGSNLLDTNWVVGDQVLGIGGAINAITDPVALGWSAITGPAVNSFWVQNLRIVSKFGTSPTAWGASTIAPDAGNGLGSMSGGKGGAGSVQVSTLSGRISNGTLTPGVLFYSQDTDIYAPPYSEYFGDPEATVGKIIFTLGKPIAQGGELYSWESFLNVSRLAELISLTDYPAVGDRGNQAIQWDDNVATDGMVVITAPIPEPLTMAGLMLGIGSVLTYVRKRRMA